MKLKHGLYVGVACLSAALSMVYEPLDAIQQSTTLDAYAGYRFDNLSTSVHSFDCDGVFRSMSRLKENRLSVWEIGLKAHLNYCSWYIRGFGSYGWIYPGKYAESIKDERGSFNKIKGKLNQGRTLDGLIGFGYLFSYDNTFGMGPVGGWSYDRQRVQAEHVEVDGLEERLLNGLTYTTQWKGPWLGVDAVYENHGLIIHAGYEFHWAHWNGQWRLKRDSEFFAHSDNRSGRSANGNVIYVDGQWNWVCGWRLGLGTRLQVWRAEHGRLTPIDRRLISCETSKLKAAKWYSAEIALDLGYVF